MKKVGTFIVGLGLGIILGALIAPQPGTEIRKKLKEKIRKPDINERISKIKSLFSKYEVQS
ncbi:MAG: YtxH domain-containing protein [candidate division WOR-3 bacterium]